MDIGDVTDVKCTYFRVEITYIRDIRDVANMTGMNGTAEYANF
jgi:hypothetical protein